MEPLLLKKRTDKFFQQSPLIHCVTNEITCESMANALLYVNSKPIMADDPREFDELFQQTNSLLLNLGHLSPEREKQLIISSEYAKRFKTPTVIDVVGVSASSLRKKLALSLMTNEPQVVKGNTSEMKKLVDLESHGRGVDGHASDQNQASLEKLSEKLKEYTLKYPETCFLATGETDVIVTREATYFLKNGVPELDKITGTGDMVGALIASLLGQGETVETSLVIAVSYFNLCGEKAAQQVSQPIPMSDFRNQLMNQLSILLEEGKWWKDIKGEIK
ncbi:hydroxyethylthiazole kinase [Vagococcus fluvialis]|uniref:hydroxyethylthiazole kinase n=1 Tax=Vagococcus fluvialis TaxID=2738 RepID=UPI001A8DAA3C|nr:hydroxyethylthiazole kinase [Vagococcus fluvialis]MBO0479082.1 hydroxyethylthiazole kinase [Vagococcus fluvialis]MBO0483475.1 hydroxyethylthiazole kinase [Vagococcus fluvialis]UDM71858.1 hydroxyethylthiazole kinase [Vagococcus fluvialis]UDM76723.1 hydroxyethylthiazole kinase [Vagococcus fluvialis]UDM83552.1 hydroxyethylthiazole kinase [Vagococcus fluvialis]